MEMENSIVQVNDLTTSSLNPLISDQKMNNDVLDLKLKLDSWKFILLPINNLLEWEHKYSPILIISLNTLLFGLLMYYNPSILTTVSIIGLVVLFIESIVPLLSSYFFKSTEWDTVSDAKYTRICERISNFQGHVVNMRVKLENTRKEKQPLYFLIVFFFLIFCAYVGQSVDNLLLTFLAVLVMSLTPGARRHKIVPKTWRKIKRTLGFGNISKSLNVNEVSSSTQINESYKTK